MYALLADIGSTYTKLSAIDLDRASLLARSSSLTTNEDVSIGLRRASIEIDKQLGGWSKFDIKRAASSAAGGLKLIAVGLVPELTGEAARLAALGAGAKVMHVYGHRLQKNDVLEMHRRQPDIILLAGGTDGGDREVLLHNASALANQAFDVAVVVAGNREVADEAALTLSEAGFAVRIAENVLPRLGQVQVDDARMSIRQVFLERIVRAKGLEKIKQEFGEVTMPTPAAVLAGLAAFSRAHGDVMAVDIGGATTDVYSLAQGEPKDDGVIPVGLRPPFDYRTVEADLGTRLSAGEVVKLSGHSLRVWARELGTAEPDWQGFSERLAQDKSWVPASSEEAIWDTVLGRACLQQAVNRHVGKIEAMVTPYGRAFLLHGKDLREVKTVIGIGGVLIHSPDPDFILGGATASPDEVYLQKPKSPSLKLDTDYVVAAAGLLSESHEDCAVKLIEQSLSR